MLWSLPPSAVQMFLDEAHAAAAAMAARPMASGWRRLDELIRDADWRPAWQIAGEAARRCRAYEKIDGAYGRALAAWYRALALVLLAGVRDTHRRAMSCGWCGSTLPPAQHPRGTCWARP